MYTRIQQRNLDRLSKSLNDGLSKLHEIWGHGCPTGMEPLLFNDIFGEDELMLREQFSKNPATMTISNADISQFLYSPEQSLIKARERITSIEFDINVLQCKTVPYNQIYDIRDRINILKRVRDKYVEQLKAKQKAFKDLKKHTTH